MSSQPIRKAVIPAAGLGTRVLPFTKTVPKELLPIAGKPLIQFMVEEAASSGIETVVLVLSRQKGLIADYFQRSTDLEQGLEQRGRISEAAAIRELSTMAEIRTVIQDSPQGLADAIACAKFAIGDEPFAVILPDVLIDAEVPATRQLMNCYDKHGGCVVAARLVQPEVVEHYGILTPLAWKDSCCSGRTFRIAALTERPKPGTVASRYGILGRYILDPEIFFCIEQTKPGVGKEVQLTDAISLCMDKLPLHAYLLEGLHHDCGEPLGHLQAEIAYGWKNPQFQAPLRKQFASLTLAAPVDAGMTRSRESRAQESYPPSKGYLSRYIKEAVQILDRIDQSDLNEVIELLLRIRQQHGRLFFLGVGESAANASHAVNDFRKIAGIESYAPTDNVAELTARINDDGWETAYRNWLQGSHLNENDAVFVLSVGGGDQERNISANLVSALRYAGEVGASICGIVGRDGGFTARVADACIIVPVVNRETVTPHTESFQSLLLHMMVSHPKLKSAEMKWESSAVQDPAA